MRKTVAMAGALLLLALLTAASLRVGAVTVPLRDIGASLLHRPNPSWFVVHEVRLPRILTAILAGFGLAVAGAILQSLIRNPLASPDVIGVTKGAGLAAAAVIFLFPGSPAYALQAAAFAGAVGAFVLLYLLSRRMSLPPSVLALIGISLGAAFQAVIQYWIVKHPGDIQSALLWMTGSLWSRRWVHVTSLLPWIAILVPLAWSQHRRLDILRLGDETGLSLGIRVVNWRTGLMLLSVLLSGISVSAVGSIGFIGMLAPQIARGLTGAEHRWLIPLSAVIGADLMLVGDMIGRIVILPREVPVGIVAAVIGAPYLLVLLYRERSGKLRMH
ncbi:FecCD family ABC transporter permease [Gorillibacterium sp. sgz5001074]|uniref:FecCD family ABC transporter permease n=1 Tax=Gorillibacterium sp. sgz5001074 TaxID=3446695 RepID=UPI003F67C352